ncbi:MAG: cell envelope-related transcriptional attenuator [uncultured bacterium]|nr:MAG: cell envelope-related transcriptional attenuator [uncultured bacterium]
MNKRSLPLKKILIPLFTVLIFFIGMVLGVVGYTIFNKKISNKSKIVTNHPLPVLIEEKRETTKDAETFNVLLTGHGGAGHSGGGLMDAIIVVHVNVTDKKANLISFPRDFWFSGHKINADPSLKDALTGVTGLPISNSISIDFISFVEMIDSLNGITVDVKKAYSDNFYPIKGKENELCGMSPEQIADVHTKYIGFELEKQFTCRYENISYGVGLNEMTGEMALKYVRSRHGGNDFERSRHQFEVLKAILQKANIASVEKAFEFVITNFTVDGVTKMLSEIGNPLEYSISCLGISDENVLINSKSPQGAYILIPKEGVNIKDYMKASL